MDRETFVSESKQVSSCQFYEIFENTFFTERFQATAFDE